MQKNSKLWKREIRSQSNCAILSNGPKISIEIERIDQTILSSKLGLSDIFICVGATPELAAWLIAYSKGIGTPLPLSSGTPFQQKMMKVMQQIPFGHTMSYQELARKAGHVRAARAAGNACKRNPFPLLIPCHRVIQSNGDIGGFAYNLEIKRRLLEFEAGHTLPQQNY